MYLLKQTQKLPIDLETCWNFFSNPQNLKLLTPEYLSFKILNDLPEKAYPGQIIHYTIKPLLNFPMEWVTEITEVEKPHYFIDEQRIGPYSFWHHEHRFKSIPNGVEIMDTVYYQLPCGLLGKIAHSLKVKADLDAIFSFRKHKLAQMFGTYPEGHA